MAQGNRLEVDVVANIRAAQKQIEALTSRPYTLNLSTKGGGFEAPLGRIKGQLGEFEKSLEASNARVIAFGASASAIYAVNTALRESVRAAVEVEKALKDINVILNLSDKSLSQFGKSLFDIAKSTGNTFATVATAATELSRQGLGVNETLKRTQDALILTRLSGLDAASSVEAITASLNGFQKAALSSTQIINKLAAVDASFAVSSADLAEAIKRVGSSAEDAGVSFDELVAIVTATQQITARGGAVIGNSFKTIFTRLQRTETLDALEQLGIQTKTTEGSIRPLIQILSDLSKTYDTLNDIQKAAVAEQVGGVFQINILKAALGDLSKEYSIFSNALQISTGATDEAIRRNEELNTTLASLLNKTIANLTAAGAKIGELSLAPALKKVFGGLNTILENFTGEESESIGGKIGEGLLKGLGNFLSGPGLIIGAKVLFNIFERLTVFTADALKTLTGLNTKAAEQAQIQQQIFSILQKNPQIIAQINSGQTSLKGLQESILTIIRAQTLAMEQQVTLSRTLAASLASAGVNISKAGPTLGRLQARASGFVPNLFNQEEANARKMGAVNPKAQMSAGTIDGQKFIKNNKEIEIVGLGSNGDSAVIPTYGSIGDKRQRELNDKLKFLGFIPNFAQTEEQLRATLNNPYASAAKKSAAANRLGLPTGFQKEKQSEGVRTIEASNTAIISSKGARNSIGVAEYDKDLSGKSLRTRFVGIHNIVPASITEEDSKKFDAIIERHLPQAMIGIANELSKGISPDTGYPNSKQIAESIRSDKSGYPQIAGRIFETAIKTAINKQLEIDKAKGDRGNQTWDFSPDDFGLQAAVTRAIFGDDQAAILMSTPYIDAKRSPVGSKDTNASLKSKFFNTPSFMKKIATAKAMARGFIPNFAGVKDAMQTEKKMGGNPALDFQEGVGLYVRDKDTQPNFAAVKKDHPEGIGQAIKNSQKAQEALARGFIPNFAPAGPENIGGGLKKAFSDEQLGPTLKKVKDNAFFASIALSTLSGIVDSFNKDGESKLGSVASEATKAASTFASIATVIPGPVGLIAGAAVGLYQAFDGISQIIRDQTGPIKKSLEETNQRISQLNDAGQAYSQAFEKLQTSYKKPEGSPEEAAKTQIKYQNDLAAALQNMPSLYREQLAEAKNLTEVQAVLAEAYAKEAAQKKQGEFQVGIAEAIKTGKQIDPQKLIQDAFKSVSPEKQKGFTEKFKKGEVSGMGRSFGSTVVGTEAGAEELSQALKDLGLNEKSVGLVMEKGKDQTRALFDALREMGVELEKSSNESDQLTKNIADQQKRDADAEEIARKKAEQAAEQAKADMIGAEAARLSAVAELKLANVRKSNLSKIASEAASAELQTAQPFTTAEGMAKGQSAIQQQRIMTGGEEQKTNIQAEAIDKMSASFSNSIQKMIDSDKTTGAQRQQLETSKGKVAEIVEGGGSPEEIAQKLENLGKELNLSDLVSVQSESAATLKSMAADIALVDENTKTSITIQEKQLQEQIKQIRDQQRVKALGGMEGFLNPESLKGPIEKMLGGFEKAQTGKQFGLETTASRGFAEAGMAALELTGGAGSSEINAALKESVVPQQTKFIEQTFKDLATQARATGTPEGEKMAAVFEKQAADAPNIAAAQFDATFQKEQLPQNVAKILDQVTKIASGDTQTSAVEEGIKDAERIGAGPAGAIDTGGSITSGLSGPPATATTISGKPLFAEKEQAVAATTETKPTTPTATGAAQAQVTAAKREFSPDINQPLSIGAKGALTSAEAEKYKTANMEEQDRLRQQAAGLSVKAAKGDSTAKAQLEQTKSKISGLSERYKGAEGVAQTLAYGERPVAAGAGERPVAAKAETMAQKLGRTSAEMEFGDVNRKRRAKEAADRFYGPEKKDKGTEKTSTSSTSSTSKGEVNVSFTPISIDIKGAIETANDELSQKMTDAIKQAVEQIAPGIISKIYGPPRDTAKT